MKKENVCEWRIIKSETAITTYETQCERIYYHNTIYPQYYNSPIDYCPYCGKKIKVIEEDSN